MTQPTDSRDPYSQFLRGRKTLRPLTFSSAILKLWNRVADNLTLEELQWFSDFDFVDMAAIDLIDAIEGIACLVANDRPENEHSNGYFHSAEGTSILLFMLVHNLHALRGLGFIANDANHRLRSKDKRQ